MPCLHMVREFKCILVKIRIDWLIDWLGFNAVFNNFSVIIKIQRNRLFYFLSCKLSLYTISEIARNQSVSLTFVDYFQTGLYPIELLHQVPSGNLTLANVISFDQYGSVCSLNCILGMHSLDDFQTELTMTPNVKWQIRIITLWSELLIYYLTYRRNMRYIHSMRYGYDVYGSPYRTVLPCTDTITASWSDVHIWDTIANN